MVSLLSKHAEKLCSRLDLATLAARPRETLTFLEMPTSAGAPLLLDTTAYIHQLNNKTPASLNAIVLMRIVNHSVVAIQELLHAIGVLDPSDARTAASVAAIRNLLDEIPSYRLFAPSREVMMDAAVYAGILCRLQSYAKDRRMKALHDCTLLLQARSLGCVLVTANVVDFDLLQQMLPDARVLFYATP